MERIEHLIEAFRVEHPEADTDLLLEFAQHVRRVLMDELRSELKANDAPVKLSMQIHGMAFSAQGPRSYVESLLEHWYERASAPPHTRLTPGFNRMRLISGR